ncbi:MAG: MBL fold metallo-hydrolase [Candidatus Edwardsbacteria bacterium]
MLLEQIVIGELETDCYLLSCSQTRDCAIIDPGAEPERILQVVRKNKFNPVYIINTHGHIDHIGGNHKIKEETKAEILIHSKDASMLTRPDKNFSLFIAQWVTSPPADRLIKEGEIIKIGSLSLEILHTPGHSPGSITLKVGGAIFCGDTLFAGSIGRTDLPGGSEKILLQSIKEKLLTLPDDTIVYPGHGQNTTIGEERKFNPFLKSK